MIEDVFPQKSYPSLNKKTLGVKKTQKISQASFSLIILLISHKLPS